MFQKGEHVRKQSGFSLIELLIVVAIILIIAAISIPNLLRARIAANEASAVSSIRTINTAQITYQSTYGTSGYASTLAMLGPTSSTGCATPTAATSCLIDYTLSTATAAPGKSGYIFNLAAFTANTSYAIAGGAVKWNQTGVRSFCSVEDAVIRAKVETATVAPSTYTSAASACMALSSLQ
jgi:type IV pilus assembly protein PilA